MLSPEVYHRSCLHIIHWCLPCTDLSLLYSTALLLLPLLFHEVLAFSRSDLGSVDSELYLEIPARYVNRVSAAVSILYTTAIFCLLLSVLQCNRLTPVCNSTLTLLE
jgi:hypothetical protein